MDRWLQPYYVKSLPSFVEDTTEFINKIEQIKLPLNCKLASIAVSSLYTNIPHKGVQSVLHFLINHPEKYKYPNAEILGELTNLVLTNNVFNNSIYKYKGQQWGQKWPQLMQTYSWANSKNT